MMQCPKCQTEKANPYPQCDCEANANRLDEVSHLQWPLNQLDEWKKFNIDAASASDAQVAFGLSLPSFTPEEAEKAWIELTNHEMLFKKVDEWRKAGYFKIEMESLDPVRKQRAHADELRQQLEDYERPELLQTDQERLKTVDFLLDSIDLLASRQWFRSKNAIEKVVVPIMAMMLDVITDSLSETVSGVYN